MGLSRLQRMEIQAGILLELCFGYGGTNNNGETQAGHGAGRAYPGAEQAGLRVIPALSTSDYREDVPDFPQITRIIPSEAEGC